MNIDLKILNHAKHLTNSIIPGKEDKTSVYRNAQLSARKLYTNMYQCKINEFIAFRYLKHEIRVSLRVKALEGLKENQGKFALDLLLLPNHQGPLNLMNLKTGYELIDQYQDTNHPILVRFCIYLMSQMENLIDLDEHQSGKFSIKELVELLDEVL